MRPAFEAILIMAPDDCAFMIGATDLVTLKAPVRPTSRGLMPFRWIHGLDRRRWAGDSGVVYEEINPARHMKHAIDLGGLDDTVDPLDWLVEA